MAFVSRSDRKYILDNPDDSKIGPGEYLTEEIPKIVQNQKIPFNSNTYRYNKIIKQDNPGPGSYFSNKKQLSPKKEEEKSIVNEKSLHQSLDATLNMSLDMSRLKEIKGKPGFGSGLRRFNDQISHISSDNTGPGMYYKDDSFTQKNIEKSKLKTSNNTSLIKRMSPKNSQSNSRLSTIPSKIHSYGYNLNISGDFYVNEDPLRHLKYLGTKSDSVGPGSYDLVKSSTKIKNTLDWSKSLKRDTESLYPYSESLKETTEDTRIEINNRLKNNRKVFKPDRNDVFKYFFMKKTKVKNSDVDLVEEEFYQQSPGPNYYNQVPPRIFYKNQKYQFFGSSSGRLKDPTVVKSNPWVGPSSYFVENQLRRKSELKKSEKLCKNILEKVRDKLPKTNSPGPGYYNIPRDIGRNYVSSVTEFGTREKRFTNLEKEKLSTANITTETNTTAKYKLKEVEQNFVNKLENKICENKSSLNLKEISRVFDIKESKIPPVGTYDPELYHSISNKINKKVSQSDNSYSPFASSMKTRLYSNIDTAYANIGPGLYYRETKLSNFQTKVPFNIGDKKNDLFKASKTPSPADYELMNCYKWNKKSYNNLFN